MSERKSIQQVAGEIVKGQRAIGSLFRQAKITGYTAGPPRSATIDIGGTTVSGVLMMDHVSPTLNEGVWFMDIGSGRWLIVGTNSQTLTAQQWQPLDTDLTAIAALTSAANKVPYSTGAGTWALADFSAAGRALVDDADASAQLTTLGVSTFVKTVLDDTTATAVLTTLGHEKLMGRNHVVNGAFRVRQRTNWSSSTANGTYGFDRWQQVNVGGTVTYSTQAFTLGSPADSTNEVANYARLVSTGQSAAGDLSILRTWLDNGVRELAGETVTLSYWAKANSGTPDLALELTQNFGTGGSPSADVNTLIAKQTITNAWVRYSHTFTVPSISGKTIGTTAATDGVALSIWTSAGSTYNSRTSSLGIQSKTIDIWGVQLERGSTATPFEDEDYSITLQKCLRFYYRMISPSAGYTVFGTGYNTSTTASAIAVIFPVPMRKPPSAIEQSGTASHYAISNSAGTQIACSAVPTFNRANNWVGYVSTTVASGLTQGHGTILQANNTASAYIGFSADY